ncbi:MAG TPA: hypothetical protein VL918_04660 [Sphingobium sp.]|nr:hypothetical protein [Sphingobium sp.]
MRIGARNIHAALAIAALGLSGGLALAAYTQSGMWPQSALPLAVSGLRQTAPTLQAAQDYPPIDAYREELHVCRGCGPTLAERQMQTYLDRLYSPGDELVAEPAPLPPEEPVPAEAETQPELTEGAPSAPAETPSSELLSSQIF